MPSDSSPITRDKPTFGPIAIVGRACVFPGALTPEVLWRNVLAGHDATGPAPAGRWRLPPAQVLAPDASERAHHDRGGYVSGFADVFDPNGFALPAEQIVPLDPLCHWVLHTARQALGGLKRTGCRSGAVLGNLSLPSESLCAFAESVWLDAQGSDFLPARANACDLAQVPRPDAANRFMSGLPAHLLATALGLDAGAFALDAACASSLYAIKLACDRLHDGAADLMLAAAVSRADDLFLHMGFTSLQALSPSGTSRPFHRDADGLLAAEGAACVALKRLEDAVRDGDTIHGVIRGIGLSNDGRASGLLVPSSDGQERAIRQAFNQSGWSPSDVGLIECHATGTPVGDATEIASLGRVFAGLEGVPLGSIKANLGHPITAAGLAGLIKVLSALESGMRPPTLHADAPLAALAGTPFRLLQNAEPWTGEAPRRAALSAFGFGGNNAHLLVEAWEPAAPPVDVASAPFDRGPIAVVGLGALVGDGQTVDDFSRMLFSGASLIKAGAAAAETLSMPLKGLRFPPADLQVTLPQQVWALDATRQALTGIVPAARERTGLWVGMQCDAAIARYGVRWRLAGWLERWVDAGVAAPDPAWLAGARASTQAALVAAGVVGTLPNVVANRLNSQFDLAGLGFAVSAEELSGVTALALAVRALRAFEVDAAVVGAVDLACEEVQAAAARATLSVERHTPGDAAVTLVLKRLADARRDGDPILALLPDDSHETTSVWPLDFTSDAVGLTSVFGHPHAASGLLHVAAAVLACHHRALPQGAGEPARPWLVPAAGAAIAVSIDALGGASAVVRVAPATESPAPVFSAAPPRVFRYGGANRAAVLEALESGHQSATGPVRLALVAAGDTEYAERRDMARRELAAASPAFAPGSGIHYREAPLNGDLACVFTGAAAAYGGMGRELALALPGLVAELLTRFPGADDAAGWIFDREVKPTPLAKLWGATWLTQLHASLTLGVLGLKPQAAIGVSSGETNALIALRAWDDVEGLYREFGEAGVFTEHLGGRCAVVRAAWERAGTDPGLSADEPAWTTWRVTATPAEVRLAIASEATVRLTVIMGPRDVVLGGPPAAVRRVIDHLAPEAALPLGYDVAVHCLEVAGYADTWRALHHRPTHPVPGVRFYSHASGGHYAPTADAAADALLGQALATVDFPALIETAYADGVRIFVEHGPQGGMASSIHQILGDRPHLAVSLDLASETPLRQLANALAALTVAGVTLDLDALAALWPTKAANDTTEPVLKFAAHAAPIRWRKPPRAGLATSSPLLVMAPAPWLPPVWGAPDPISDASPLPTRLATATPSAETLPDSCASVLPVAVATALPAAAAQTLPALPAPATPRQSPGSGHDPLRALMAARHQAQTAYMAILSRQAEVHQQFLAHSGAAFAALMGQAPATLAVSPPPTGISPPVAGPIPVPLPIIAPLVAATAPASVPPVAAVVSPLAARANTSGAFGAFGPAPTPQGPTFDRAQLEILASGRISSVFGSLFEVQDGFVRQVRMPEPPLLLADRVTGIKGDPGSMRTGTIWTETDVRWDSWYLHQGRMPAGLMIESGQADLLLISWLGADFQNRSERVYRLLGCELTYHTGRPDEPTGADTLPRPGDTLCYDIHVDGHARQGDIRLFFFHYDCRIRDAVRLSVRHGQAGFFTDEELAASGGVLWEPTDDAPQTPGRIDPPQQLSSHRSFDEARLKAFAAGRMADCFGEGFAAALSHVRSPRISEGRMRFLEEVTELDPTGGPWGRGYLRARATVSPQDWFFDGHFKNDPCMPGTLMFDGCLQAMAFYLAALGYGLNKDGWTFEPVPGEAYLMRCRGQVQPTSRELVYELFVHEVHEGPWPTLYADLLCTVDGLKAFHCRRMGYRLVPGFPLEERPEMDEVVDIGAVAHSGTFAFGQRSLWACAWGRPSEAFGPAFLEFDGGKRLPRLPGPPYHFMSRITQIDGEIGVPRIGSAVEVAYDVPPDAWYFAENGCASMPLCVLMEAALQPCGWLASFIGTPLTSPTELFFRNLDGTGTQTAEVVPGGGVLRTTATLTSLSRSAGMVIVSFKVACHQGETPVFAMSTVFGFFPGGALASQVGIVASPEELAALQLSSDFHVDFGPRPARYCLGAARLAGSHMLMLDRVTGYWPTAGRAGLGRLRAEKDVDPSEWFFKSHFFQDPVQPGSLGIEAMAQLLQFYMLERGLGEGLVSPRFEPLALGCALTWKYRGQVVPTNGVITTEVEVTAIGTDERGAYAIAEAALWVDGMRIYTAINLGMRLVEGATLPPQPPLEEVLDPARDTWLQDHKPTYVIPVLPFMSILDRLAAAAQAARPQSHVVALEDVHVLRWVALPGGPMRLRTAVEVASDGRLAVTLSRWWDAPNAALSRFEPVATGLVTLSTSYLAPPAVWDPLLDTTMSPDPYADGTLFHGPVFQILRKLELGPTGSSAVLDASPRPGVPRGVLNQIMLDGITHAIPNDNLASWSNDIAADRVGYPSRVTAMHLYGPTPSRGLVHCEVRFAGFHTLDGANAPDLRFPKFRAQLITAGQVWLELELVSVLFPKGPLGSAPAPVRRAFLAERVAVPHLGLSRLDQGATRLTAHEVKGSDWLPGTLAHVYAATGDSDDLTRQIAAKEHVARLTHTHPAHVQLVHDGGGGVCPGAPLTRHDLDLMVAGDEVTVMSMGAPVLDISPVRDYWRERLAIGPWPGEDLYYGLAERFVEGVVLADPESFEVVKNRSVLYLANHQVGIESLLFSLLISGISGVPTATLAKVEHRDSWLGRLIAHHFAYPGVIDPGLIVFFDRQDPASLPGLLKSMQGAMHAGGKSLMIHVDGTRALRCRQPVANLSATFLDLAIAAELPVVPVRFVGGLPVADAKERLEFPWEHARQVYHVGRPFWPDELRALPYAERKRQVLEAMNALGPALDREMPGAPDGVFSAEVAGYRARTGVAEVPATLFKTLENLARPSTEIREMVQALRRGQPYLPANPADPRSMWLTALGRWLSGSDATLDLHPVPGHPPA